MKNQDLLDLYISQFRNAGRRYKHKAKELQKFINFCATYHDAKIDYKALLRWLEIREKTLNPVSIAGLHNQVSTFAEWASLLDKSVGKIPRAGRIRVNRRQPNIIFRKQVNKIVKAQRNSYSRKGINPRTFGVITGLLFVTGMRISEALELKKTDVNFKERTIYIPAGKSPQDRVIPISKSTVRVLKKYVKWRDNFERESELFFIHDVVDVKTPYSIFRRNFTHVAEKLGHRVNGKGRLRTNLTIHDIRHSFAVNSLIKIYESGVDVNEAIEQLSSIMGHKTLNETYWYIEAVPELIAAAFRKELS